MTSHFIFIIMGVSGSGKSTIGEQLANKLNIKFIDGDHLHPQSNIDKMSKGQPLNDNDRQPWLENINNIIKSYNKNKTSMIIVCSALKKSYRNILRNNTQVKFIYLKSNFNEIFKRLKSRENHFMPLELLQSQFQTLEEPDTKEENDVFIVDIVDSIENVVDKCSHVVQKHS